MINQIIFLRRIFLKLLFMSCNCKISVKKKWRPRFFVWVLGRSHREKIVSELNCVIDALYFFFSEICKLNIPSISLFIDQDDLHFFFPYFPILAQALQPHYSCFMCCKSLFKSQKKTINDTYKFFIFLFSQ